MFLSVIFSLLTAVFYLLAALWVVLFLTGKAQAQSLLVRLLGFTAWIFHTLSLAGLINWQMLANLDFMLALSLANWLICGIILLLSLKKPSLNLAGLAFPLAAFAVLGTHFYTSSQTEEYIQYDLLLHIVISLAAYSFFALASIQAVLFGLQNTQLKQRNFKGLVKVLPPLQSMERLLFEFIYLGQILLSLGILTGFIFLDNLFASGLLHKTLLSIAAWLIFGGLIAGRHFLGWRGQTAVKFTLGGSSLLLLAYFGSKFVLQFILDKV